MHHRAIKRYIFTLASIVLIPLFGYSQRVALSSDALKWATFTANVGADLSLSNHLSLNVEASYNPTNKYITDKLSLHHFSVSPEFRYWIQRPFYSHYIGVNMLCSTYDLVLGEHYRDGLVVAIGVGYGYSIMLSDRWNLMPSLGVGVGCVSYLSHPVVSDYTPKITKLKLIPTRLGLAFTYIID